MKGTRRVGRRPACTSGNVRALVYVLVCDAGGVAGFEWAMGDIGSQGALGHFHGTRREDIDYVVEVHEALWSAKAGAKGLRRATGSEAASAAG